MVRPQTCEIEIWSDSEKHDGSRWVWDGHGGYFNISTRPLILYWAMFSFEQNVLLIGIACWWSYQQSAWYLRKIQFFIGPFCTLVCQFPAKFDINAQLFCEKWGLISGHFGHSVPSHCEEHKNIFFSNKALK